MPIPCLLIVEGSSRRRTKTRPASHGSVLAVRLKGCYGSYERSSCGAPPPSPSLFHQTATAAQLRYDAVRSRAFLCGTARLALHYRLGRRPSGGVGAGDTRDHAARALSELAVTGR